jgi:predicted phosphohydrolase
MAVYAISDLHLSFSSNKPMDKFGEKWTDYTAKIEANWHATVREEDVVLIGGDISWAMHLPEAKEDLDWISNLPGHKYLIKGNHDFWWTSLKKMTQSHPHLRFVFNNGFQQKNIAIAGTRGWICPNTKEFTSEDLKIYQRELLRLENSLKQAVKEEPEHLIAMIHYPPTNDSFEDSGFTNLFEAYGVSHVIYGHLHTPEGFKVGFTGEKNGVMYHLTSCDYLDFKLEQILD